MRDSRVDPEPSAPPPPEPVPEITLEEWIAASQSCCAGPTHDGDGPPAPPRDLPLE